MVTLKSTTLTTLYTHEKINCGYRHYITIISQLSFDEITRFMGHCIEFYYSTPQYSRKFSGYLISVAEGKVWHNCFNYKICLASSLTILEQDIDYRIYKNLSLKSIINTLFKLHGFLLPIYQTKKAEKIINYCVQYNENSSNFIRRIIDEHSLCLFYNNNHLVISDQKNLMEQEQKQLRISELKLADYHAWHWSKKSCYSNYPHLQIGNKINNENIITEIRHYINNIKHYYYQHIQYRNSVPTPIALTPKISGIQLGKLKTNRHIQADWNHETEMAPCPYSLLPYKQTPLLNFASQKECELIIDYHQRQCTHPFINGYLYSPQYNAPFASNFELSCQGLRSAQGSKIEFSKHTTDRLTDITLESFKNISHQLTYDFNIIAQKYLTLKAHQTLQLHAQKIMLLSNTHITIKAGRSKILISKNKIRFQSPCISF